MNMPHDNSEMIPEYCTSSARVYERYPKRNISPHSTIVELVMNLNLFNTKELIAATTTPIRVEIKIRPTKLPSIKIGVVG